MTMKSSSDNQNHLLEEAKTYVSFASIQKIQIPELKIPAQN